MKLKFNILLLILVCILSGCNFKLTLPSLNQPTTNDKNDSNGNDQKDEVSYYGSDNDIYRINITTSDSSLPTSTSTYKTATLNITEQDTSKILFDTSNIKIRVRGNSTSAPDKKPYKIKFDVGTSLFGLTKAKDWVLLANYFDRSNIRNYLAYTLANKLDNLDFQPSCIFVDLYINNEYRGLYTLCEQIEANKGRVDIKKNISQDEISSFLLEVDDRAQDEYKGYKNKCYFTIGEYDIAFKYPSATEYIEALEINDQAYIDEYIKNTSWAINYFNEVNTVIKNGTYTQIESYLDIDSFIDYYFVQEFFKNVDVSSTSQFYVIDQALDVVKIKCGPVWDFDISSGVIDNSQGSTYSYYTNTELYVRNVDYFYKTLFGKREFNEKVKERYNEIRPLLLETISEIENIKNSLTKAQTRNIRKWNFPTTRQYWIEVNGMANSYFNLTSVNNHYKYLKEFLEARVALLDKNYL